MRFLPLYLAGLIATASAVAPAKASTSLDAADPILDLIGAPNRDAHKGRTNPDAVQDGWPDCSVPDEANNYFTQCAPTPVRQPKLIIEPSSLGSARLSTPRLRELGHRCTSRPSRLRALTPNLSPS
jgi:hypothetical protein